MGYYPDLDMIFLLLDQLDKPQFFMVNLIVSESYYPDLDMIFLLLDQLDKPHHIITIPNHTYYPMCINLPTMYIKYKQGYGHNKPYLLTPLKKHKPTTNLQLVNSPENLMQSLFLFTLLPTISRLAFIHEQSQTNKILTKTTKNTRRKQK